MASSTRGRHRFEHTLLAVLICASLTRLAASPDASDAGQGIRERGRGTDSASGAQGMAAYSGGRKEDALRLFAQACEEEVGYCVELSVTLRELGFLPDSIAAAEAALWRRPGCVRTWTAYGLSLASSAHYQRAVTAFHTAYLLSPENKHILVNIGQALLQLGDKHRGHAFLFRAYRHLPTDVDVIMALVDFYVTHDLPGKVSEFLNQALTIAPDDPRVLHTYATVLSKVADYERALAVRRRIVRKSGQTLDKCKLLQLAQSVAAWDDVESLLPQVMAAMLQGGADVVKNCQQPLEVTMNPLYSEEQLQWVTRTWAESIIWTLPGTRQTAESLAPPPWGHGLPAAMMKDRGGNGLRVGYLSSNLQGGAVFLMIQGLWRSHAHAGVDNGAGVSVYTYSTVVLENINNKAESYRELEAYTELRQLPYPGDRIGSGEMIRRDNNHVLVNVNGWCDAGANELLPARLAPVQMSYMGYPGSMGAADWTDILISDSIASPPEWQHHYTEKLMYIPYSYYINDFRARLPEMGDANLARGDGSLAPAATGNLTRRALALPDDAFVYVCFSRAEKIDRDMFGAWMRILEQTPNSVLWLLKDTKGKVPGETFVTKHLKATAAAFGVDPSRLIFAQPIQWADHVRRGALADLFLDTWAYNAHSTGCNSLWAGVPLLTMADVKMAQRVAAGMNRAASAGVYTVRTREEYVDLAVRLGRNARRSQRLRSDVFANRVSVPLFQTRAMVHTLERGYRMSADVYAHTGLYMHLVPSWPLVR